ncbi:DUF6093 family protein [Streptomyces beijiangensis]|uniref:Uncharacterized protein n=1 Tax=Streptomyces beijiangensis TaxID=163361 RepID=A0A939F5U7_9ACTN|nr:DUF6093 family protein [Streptomyces beijiangensis]MBO0512443.1 hypothetical protein [Streptomyces beijiangensis]
MLLDIPATIAQLEGLLVDTVRISRLSGAPIDPDTGEPVREIVYEGQGALLSTHGQITATQMTGVDWAGESAAWYQLLTPLTAPVAEPGDQVEVIGAADTTSVAVGRLWYAEARTQASTWEVVRVTRLDEQGGSVGAML